MIRGGESNLGLAKSVGKEDNTHRLTHVSREAQK